MARKIQVVYNGITFDSKLECQIYQLIEKDTDIKILETHKKFLLSDKVIYHDILSNKNRILRESNYTCDFLISVNGINKPLVIEVKGFKRPEYQVRKKRFISKYHNDYYFIEIGSMKDYNEKIEIIKSNITEENENNENKTYR